MLFQLGLISIFNAIVSPNFRFVFTIQSMYGVVHKFIVFSVTFMD